MDNMKGSMTLQTAFQFFGQVPLLLQAALAFAGLVLIPTSIFFIMYMQVAITSPKDGLDVEQAHLIKGKISNPKAQVWIIIHPIGFDGYTVQPLPDRDSNYLSIRGDSWSVRVEFGRLGQRDAGKTFEVMAVANPKRQLARGDTLNDWPEAKASSRIIKVTRQ